MIIDDDQLIDELATDCVQDMGDIFWDYEHAPANLGYSDPTDVAVRAVRATLGRFAHHRDTSTVFPSVLRQEYATLVSRIGDEASQTALINALVADADWTMETATTLIGLARKHGIFVLRSALALAEALGIEDGDDGA